MKITINKLRYKNFISYGNTFVEIDFTSHKTTLIKGTNGVGKSTMLDALCFCFFGKGYRKANKPTLVNSINEGDMIVEGEFIIGKNNYLIRRGLKPNIFELYCNGQLVNQTASSKDYQKYLEENILKLNFKAFTQIVVLGRPLYVPFMQLTSADRREFIEDLLDIKIYSLMSTLIKTEANTLRSEIESTEQLLKSVNEKIELTEKYLKSISTDSENKLNDLYARKNVLESEINVNTGKLNKADALLQTLEHEKLMDKIVVKEKEKVFLEVELTKLNNNLSFFTDNKECVTCAQSINNIHKANQLKDINEKIIKTKVQLDTEILPVLDKLYERHKKVEELKKIVTSIKFSINVKNIELEKVNYAIDKEKKNISIDDLKLKLVDFNNERDIILKDREKYIFDNKKVTTALTLMKDGGIKSCVIKQYVPIINSLINKYLKLFNFPINFNIDENFDEVIKSRYRDEFSYGNFSEGEKQRIDLALVFAWRQVAKVKNSTNINVLFMDEIFDSSLDEMGVDCALKIFNNSKDNSNIFIITHKNGFDDKFERVMQVEKVRNFSKLTIQTT